MANEEENLEEEAIDGLELENSEKESTEEELENTSSEEESSEVDEEESSSNSSESEESSESSQVNEKDNTSDEVDDEAEIAQKSAKLKKILMIVVGVLSLILTAGLLYFFLGTSEPEELTNDENDTKTDKNKQISNMPLKKQYEFKVKDINKKRLNRKLSFLTKDEIIEEEEQEKTVPVVPKIKKEETFKEEKNEVITSSKKDEEKEIKVSDKSPANTKPIKIESTSKIEPSEENIESNFEELASSESDSQNITEDNIIESNKPIVVETDRDEISKEENKDSLIANQPIESSGIEVASKKNVDKVINDTIPTEADKVENEALNKDEVAEEIKNDINQNQSSSEEISNNKSFLKFAQIATIKSKLYLSFLHKVHEIDKRISVCRNEKNLIQVFVGPFKDDKDRNNTLSKINSTIVKDAFAIDFTKEEFDKRCML